MHIIKAALAQEHIFGDVLICIGHKQLQDQVRGDWNLGRGRYVRESAS